MDYKINKKKVIGLVIVILFLVSGIGSILFSNNSQNNNLITEKDDLDLKSSFINTTLEYTGESYELERGISNPDPEDFSIHYYNGFWYIIEKQFVYKYYANWTVIIEGWFSFEEDSHPNSFFFYEFWYVLGSNTNTVYQYTNTSGETTDAWEYTGVSFSLNEQDIDPVAIHFYNGFWYMLGFNSSSVYQYDINWIYTGLFFDISEQVLNPYDFQFVDGYWWVLGSDRVYKYDINWMCVNVNYISPEGSLLVCLFSLDGISFWMIGKKYGEVRKYEFVETYYEFISINFTLFDQNNNLLDNSSYSLYINGTKVSFGLVELNSSDILITVYDRFNVIVFNQIESLLLAYLLGDTEYNIISIVHTVQFGLFDQNNNQLDDSSYLLYINNVKRNFGFIELNSITTTVIVYDRFNAVVFNGTGFLIGKTNFKIEIEVYRLRIKHLSDEIGNFTLSEKITHNSVNFTMNPNSVKTFLLVKSYYNLTWLNGENLETYEYDITLNQDRFLTLESVFYTVYFSIFNFDGLGLVPNFVRFYVNGVRKDFGDVILNQKFNELKVLDFFNNTLYDSVVDLSNKTEWNIYVEIYSITLYNNCSFPIDLIVERNGFSISIEIQAESGLLYRFVPNVNYYISWSYTNGTFIDEVEISFSESGQTVSFGIVSGLNSNIKSDDLMTILILIITVIIEVVLISSIIYFEEYKKREVRNEL